MMLAAVLVTTMMTGLAAQSAAESEIPSTWLGRWRLDVERSTYIPGPAPYRRGTLTVERFEGGVRLISELVGVRGGITRTEWTGLFDGKDYPLQGIDEVLSYAYRAIDDRTWEILVKADGRLVATARATLSADGRTLTTTTSGRNARGGAVSTTTVYEKVDGS